MSESSKFVAGLVALALLLGVTYLLVKNNEAKSPRTSIPIYTSGEYGYAFSYDGSYALTTFAPEYVTLEDTSRPEPNEVVEVALVKADAETQYASFEDFVHDRSLIFCAADGPGGSTSCNTVSRTQPFTTATGIKGEIFYLEFVHLSPEGESRREAGPFYAFDVSANVQGGDFAALTFRPARFYEESDMYDEGAKVANDIVNTLQIAR